MSVRQVDMIAAVLVTLVGIFFMGFSVPMYASRIGNAPGPGVWPFWVGMLQTLCGLGYLWYAFRSRTSRKFLNLSREELTWLLESILSLVVYVAIMPYTGFMLSTFLFMGFNIRMIAGYRWRSCLAISLGSTIACWYLFVEVLFVPLPKGPLGI